MSIRIASLLLSLLAHGTAYLYLGDFISLDGPNQAETGQGMKIALVRVEKSPQHQGQLPIAASEPEPVETVAEMTPAPVDEKRVEKQDAGPDELREAAQVLVEQINELPPTAAGKPVKVAAKVPKSVKKRLPEISQKAQPPEVKPQPETEVAIAAVVASSDSSAAPAEAPINRDAQAEIDRLLAIESAYAQALVAAIEKHKRYPLRARKKGQEGEVKVLFTVLEDGTIAQVQIGESSLSSILDRAASRAVEQLGRFQPIPEQLGRKRWEFQVPVRFAMN